ncbi:kinase-like domain-containing protein [Chytridium lagenaria]|nr:kinase-like domain-containing protein [Chytridium lagenaria]
MASTTASSNGTASSSLSSAPTVVRSPSVTSSNSAILIPPSAVNVDTSALIGSGAAGAVYKARYANETVAVKRLKVASGLSSSAQEDLKAEASTLAKINHPRIVRFLGVVMDDGDNFSIILEYLPLGSLYNYYMKEPRVPHTTRLSLAADIATGMDFLHKLQPPILHRDLKSLNILLHLDAGGDLHAKITDFGIAVVMQHTLTAALVGGGQQRGTLIWMAPELHNLKTAYRPACDVYAFGVVLSEFFSWLGPFGIPVSELRHDVLLHMLTGQKKVPDVDIDEDAPDGILSLIQSCISFEPSERPSFGTVTIILDGLMNGVDVDGECFKEQR